MSAESFAEIHTGETDAPVGKNPRPEEIRQAVDQLILVSPDEQPSYLHQIAKLTGELLNEKEIVDPFESIFK